MAEGGAGTSDNALERVWLAYAWERPLPPTSVERALDRVAMHYQRTVAEPLERHSSIGPALGLALLARPDPRLRRPLWVKTDDMTAAAAGVPTGWERVSGPAPATEPVEALARALAVRPERAGELNPPFVMGILHEGGRELTVVNDALGVGRLYEMRTAHGRVWSNRLGALPLFAGVRPEPDERAWRMFAAAGWFLGASTPILGAEKVPPGTVIAARSEGPGALAGRRATGARGELVRPRRARLARSAEAAAEEARGLAGDIADSWDSPLAIALTGGRDSRVSAAAALAAGVDATYNTGDQVPGELDVVRELIARAPAPMPHEVRRPDPGAEPSDDLLERTAAIHLMHDGMRNPQEVRRSLELPHARRLPPNMSGHGGELGHGFYYHSSKQLRRLRRGGDEGMMSRLEAAGRRRHSAAVPAAYEEYLAECERTLSEGRSHGLRGPVLLDFFYLAQRLAYRSGLGSRDGRYSACVTPAFVRGCFDLRPAQRLDARFHRLVIARLVEGWKRVEFFSSASAPMPEINRRRIWERPREAGVVATILQHPSGWEAIFEPERLRAMWAEVTSGAGSADYEHLFYRLVWRVAFDEHLAGIAAAIDRPLDADAAG